MGVLQGWHDFFLLTGTAAATLLGLVFVAASIAATVPNEKLGDEVARSLWVLPIVYAFVRVLVVSALGVMPIQTAFSFGAMIVSLATLDVWRTVWVWRGLRAHRLPRGNLGWYVVYPAVATGVVIVGGVDLATGRPHPMGFVAAGLIGHLVIGVHNAWELADWLATRQ